MVNVFSSAFVILKAALAVGFIVFFPLCSDAQKSERPASVQRKPKTAIYNIIGSGVFVFGENILLRAADGRTEKIDIKYTGFSLGYSLLHRSRWWSYGAEIQGAFLQGSAVSENINITYESKSIVTPAAVTTVSGNFHPTNRVFLGLGAGALYSRFKLDPPQSAVTSYDFKYSNALKPFVQFQISWLFTNQWSVVQKILTFSEPDLDTAWGVSIHYKF